MVKKRYRKTIEKQTHVRIYVKDLNFLRRRFPNINAAEIIRTLKKKC